MTVCYGPLFVWCLSTQLLDLSIDDECTMLFALSIWDSIWKLERYVSAGALKRQMRLYIKIGGIPVMLGCLPLMI